MLAVRGWLQSILSKATYKHPGYKLEEDVQRPKRIAILEKVFVETGLIRVKALARLSLWRGRRQRAERLEVRQGCREHGSRHSTFVPNETNLLRVDQQGNLWWIAGWTDSTARIFQICYCRPGRIDAAGQ